MNDTPEWQQKESQAAIVTATKGRMRRELAIGLVQVIEACGIRQADDSKMVEVLVRVLEEAGVP